MTRWISTSRKSKKRAFVGIFVLVLIVPFHLHAGGRTEVTASQDENTRVMYVHGFAGEELPNREARIRLGVEVRMDSAEEAHHEAARRSDALVRALRELGVSDLGTSGLQLRVEHRTVDGRREIAGYVAVNTVSFVTPVERAGEAIDRSVSTGAQRIDGISFQPSAAERQQAMQRVETAAARDAVERGDRILTELGLTRREIGFVRVVEDGHRFAMDGLGGVSTMRAEAVPSTPVEAGSSRVEARVEMQIRY